MKEAIATFYGTARAGKKLAEKANGMLVVPKVIEASFAIAGKYGEGALLIDGQPMDYYSVAASVAIADIGAGGEIGTHTAREPLIGFIFSNKGLMYDPSLAGSKITKLSR